MSGNLSAVKFARLAKRLASRPDRSDHGQLLPSTAAALEVDEAGARLTKLVRAIQKERLIVPVPVEAHPDEAGRHEPQDLHPDARIPLRVLENEGITSVAVFSSAASLQRWDPGARPLAMSAQKACITAVALGVPRLCLDPGQLDLVIPRAAVESLAAGGDWLPAWEDDLLRGELNDQARDEAEWASFVGVQILPGADGAIVVEVVASPKRADESLVRSQFAALIGSLAKNPRLAGATERVSFVPKLAPLA